MGKLSVRQLADSLECEEMQDQGKYKGCMECSCMVCLAQEPTDLASGLEMAVGIIEKEMEFAVTVNSQMALGMSQVLMLIEKEIGKQ